MSSKVRPQLQRLVTGEKLSSTAFKPLVWILLADSFSLEHYRNSLRSTEYEFIYLQNPLEWESRLEREKPALLVIDLSLNPSDPIGTLYRVKSLSPQTEIIVLSNTDDVHLAIASFKAGITDYYLKPTNPETLQWAIQKTLRQKALKPVDPTLQADLKMFSVTHHISVAETDTKMRETAMEYLVESLQAKGGAWLWPLQTKAKFPKRPMRTVTGAPYAIESYQCSMRLALAEFREFQKQFPAVLDDSFETHLTSHPEHWFRLGYTWIPLQHSHMGGVLIFGVKASVNTALQARTEFLIRSLEVSLENHRRYIEAKQLTYIDDLTGLYNPRYLEVALTAAIANAHTAEQGFCILFIDIDRFKAINDQHGHVIGSQMLTHIGRLLKQCLRKVDHVFRYGGDEYIAVLYGVKIPEAKEIAERIRTTTERRVFRFPNTDVKVTLSIGISRFPEHGKDKKSIIDMADRAMYESKRQGRNLVFIAE